MKSIFGFKDYRKYLLEVFEAEKKVDENLGQKVFAKRFGVSAPSLNQITKGNRNLTIENIFRFAEVLRLDESETFYFEALVHYNQAKEPLSKQHYKNRLRQISSQYAGKRVNVSDKMLFSDWRMVPLFIYLYDFCSADQLLSDSKKLKLLATQLDMEVGALKTTICELERRGFLDHPDLEKGMLFSFRHLGRKEAEKNYVLGNMERMREAVRKGFGSEGILARTLTITLTEGEKEQFCNSIEKVFQKFSGKRKAPDSNIYQFDYQCLKTIQSNL